MTRAYRLEPVFILFASLFSIPSAALSQSQSAPPENIDEVDSRSAGVNGVDQVYAYAFRERKADDIGGAVTVITADDIDVRQLSFLADALKEAPGVAIARNGSFGGFASARIRGGSGGQTLVVIDGIVVNDPTAPQGGFNFANLDVADIEQIEVLRGPQSLIWGADAIGGVISIRTKDAGPRLSAYAEGGSRGTVRSGATFFTDTGGAFARLTVSGVRSDGISRAASGVENDGYRSLAASATAGVELSAGTDLRFNARFSESRAEIDGFPPPSFAFGDTEETEDTTDYALSARLSHRAGNAYRGALSLAYSGIDRHNDDLDVRTFSAVGDRLSANYWGAYSISPSLSVEAGAEAERSSVDVSGVDEGATSGAIFALVEARPVKSIVLSAGVRRDEFSSFEGATTSRLAGVWTLSQGNDAATRLRASWGQGFRSPTLFELNFDQFGFTPNPDLRPERANGYDVGLEQEIGAAGSLRLRATYFRQRVKDQIDFDFAGSGFFNIDRVKSRGVEVEVDWAVCERLDARVTYALVDAEDELTGAAILRTPRHSGAATITYRPTDALSLSSTVAFNGREEDFPAPNESFVRADVRASYALSPALEIYGRIENVTDTDYEDVSGFGEPGASAFAGLRVRL